MPFFVNLRFADNPASGTPGGSPLLHAACHETKMQGWEPPTEAHVRKDQYFSFGSLVRREVEPGWQASL